MKNRKTGLISCVLILFVSVLFVFFYNQALSAEVTIDSLNSTCDEESKIVKISGVLSSGKGQNVSLRVTDPEGRVAYVNQTTAGDKGSFEFQYIMAEGNIGTYLVEVNAKGLNSPVRTTFVYGSVLKGDLNGDGKVNSTDYALLRRYLLELIDEFPVKDGLKAADINGDGKVNSTDYAALKRQLLGIGQ